MSGEELCCEHCGLVFYVPAAPSYSEREHHYEECRDELEQQRDVSYVEKREAEEALRDILTAWDANRGLVEAIAQAREVVGA